MRYFLTGATGFIGGRLAAQLQAEGHEVHALVRRPEEAGALQKLGVKLFPGDITDKESMRSGMSDVDGLFHVGGWYKIGARDPSAGQRVNVDGTRNVLELMGELGVAKGVYTSTIGVYSDTHGRLVDESHRFRGRHLSEYDRTKAEAHEMALEMAAQGLPLVITMPGVVYGPGDPSNIGVLLRDYLQRRLSMVPRRTAFCWGYVEDVARGLWLAMQQGKPGESYHLAGEPATVEAVLALAEKITSIPAPPSVPPWMLLALSRVMEPIGRLVRLPEMYTAEALRVSAGVTYLGDNARAIRELGFDPRPLRQGLEQTLRQEMTTLGLP